MCILIDANKLTECFSLPVSDNALPIMQWLLSGRGKIVIGGKLLKEYHKVDCAKRWIKANWTNGKVFQVSDSEIEARKKALNIESLATSNDHDQIAVMIISGCKLAFTDDVKFITDLKNRAFFNPRAKVYRKKEHRNLLTRSRGCS